MKFVVCLAAGLMASTASAQENIGGMDDMIDKCNITHPKNESRFANVEDMQILPFDTERGKLQPKIDKIWDMLSGGEEHVKWCSYAQWQYKMKIPEERCVTQAKNQIKQMATMNHTLGGKNDYLTK